MSEDDLYNEMVLFSNKASDVDKEAPMEKKKTETFSVFIGNLTWWTTDQDLMDLVAGAGVTDVVDILIHENAPNGLSKGYATVTVESVVSLQLMMNKLPNKIVHNKGITVDSFTIANQTKYENTFKDMIAKTSKVNSIKSESLDAFLNPSVNKPTIHSFPVSTGTGAVPRNIIPQPVLIVSYDSSQNPPPMLSVPPPLLYTVLNPGQPLPHQINQAQSLPHQIRYPVIMNNPPPPYLPTSQHAPQPINQKAIVVPNAAMYKGKMLTKEEFEEVFTLNKKVAEQSIKRASADAEAGNYSEAIETLVTAISLIKESKLGMDTQGVALMKPLQDLLLDIETDSIKAKQNMKNESEKSPISLHNNNRHLNDRDDRRNDHDDRRDDHDDRRGTYNDHRDIRGERRDDYEDRRDDHDDRRDDRDDRRDDRIRKMSLPSQERRRISRSPQRFRRRSRSPLLEERYSPMRFTPGRDIGHRGDIRDGRMRDERDYSRRFDRNYRRRF